MGESTPSWEGGWIGEELGEGSWIWSKHMKFKSTHIIYNMDFFSFVSLLYWNVSWVMYSCCCCLYGIIWQNLHLFTLCLLIVSMGTKKHIQNVTLEESLQFHRCLGKAGKSAVSKSGCTSQTGENWAEPSVMEPTAKPNLGLPCHLLYMARAASPTWT